VVCECDTSWPTRAPLPSENTSTNDIVPKTKNPRPVLLLKRHDIPPERGSVASENNHQKSVLPRFLFTIHKHVSASCRSWIMAYDRRLKFSRYRWDLELVTVTASNDVRDVKSEKLTCNIFFFVRFSKVLIYTWSCVFFLIE